MRVCVCVCVCVCACVCVCVCVCVLMWGGGGGICAFTSREPDPLRDRGSGSRDYFTAHVMGIHILGTIG